MILNFKELKKSVRNINKSNFDTSLNIALLGNHTTHFFKDSLEKNFLLSKFSPNFYEGDYDQVDINIIDLNSALYSHNPNVIIIFESSLKLKDLFYNLALDKRAFFYEDRIRIIKDRIVVLKKNLPTTKIIYFTYELFDDQVFGDFYSKVDSSFYLQLLKINSELQSLNLIHENLYLFEINKYLLTQPNYRDWGSYINFDMHFSLDMNALLSYHVCNYIKTFTGQIKKCLILDLDNTLWGGVIGDDGLENIQIGNLGIGKAYTNIQRWAKELKERGVLLAICSKNSEEIAKEPFEKHTEMVLKLSDIAIFVANWENKADNILHIQKVLNIGLDSMVFLDDNPAERMIVKKNLPEVTVPELPSDPVLYYPYLLSLNLFQTSSFNNNDKERTKQYQNEAKRESLRTSTVDFQQYLKSLEMIAEINPFQEKDVSRIAQLTQRSNQFNLRTIRYTDLDILKFMKSDNYLTYAVHLKDKFGSHGLISLVILKKKQNNYFIDTWIMSCRVLKRGVESFILNKLVEDLLSKKEVTITGEYVETPKNKIVSSLLSDLTFNEYNNNYKLDLNNYKKINNQINES